MKVVCEVWRLLAKSATQLVEKPSTEHASTHEAQPRAISVACVVMITWKHT